MSPEEPSPASRATALRRVLVAGMLAMGATASLSACLFAPVIAVSETPTSRVATPSSSAAETPAPDATDSPDGHPTGTPTPTASDDSSPRP